MKSLKTYFISLLAGLFIISCQKEHITTANTTVGNPVFYFNGTVGGNNVRLQAGKSNYYMYSSYSQNSAGVYSFIGNLKEFGCNNGCASSIEFIINNYRTLAAGVSESNINTSFAYGYYGYADSANSVTKYSISYIPNIDPGSAAVKSFIFHYGDGTPDTFGSVLPVKFAHTYFSFGHYNTSLTVAFTDGSNSTISIPSSFTPRDSATNAISNVLSITSHSGSTVTFIDSPSSPLSASDTININFGDPTSSSNTLKQIITSADTFSHVFNDTSSICKLMALLTLNAKDTVFSALSMKPGSSSPLKDIANYTISAPKISSNPDELSNVTIMYTDPSGDVYTTADSAQKIESFFQVVSVAPYNNNENNQTTKQLHIKFNCTLYDNKGKSLTITNGDAVIAVAYK
jgi:hypothetical protein